MQLTRTEIIDKLKDILLFANENNTAVIENCTEQLRLVEDLGLTSVGMQYIVIAIEEEFGIRFDNVGVADFVTIRDVVDYIEAKLG